MRGKPFEIRIPSRTFCPRTVSTSFIYDVRYLHRKQFEKYTQIVGRFYNSSYLEQGRRQKGLCGVQVEDL